MTMDKKARKRLQILKERLQNRRLRLAAAIAQPDEPGEAQQARREIESIEEELRRLQEK